MEGITLTVVSGLVAGPSGVGILHGMRMCVCGVRHGSPALFLTGLLEAATMGACPFAVLGGLAALSGALAAAHLVALAVLAFAGETMLAIIFETLARLASIGKDGAPWPR